MRSVCSAKGKAAGAAFFTIQPLPNRLTVAYATPPAFDVDGFRLRYRSARVAWSPDERKALHDWLSNLGSGNDMPHTRNKFQVRARWDRWVRILI